MVAHTHRDATEMAVDDLRTAIPGHSWYHARNPTDNEEAICSIPRLVYEL